MDILTAIVTGSVGAALIKILDTLIAWRLRRRDKLDDKTNTAAKQQADRQRAISDGLRVLLYDRIRHLGRGYIADGAVDFDDRRILSDMHQVYHNGLDGNGDLDVLMGQVNNLPLKGA